MSDGTSRRRALLVTRMPIDPALSGGAVYTRSIAVGLAQCGWTVQTLSLNPEQWTSPYQWCFRSTIGPAGPIHHAGYIRLGPIQFNPMALLLVPLYRILISVYGRLGAIVQKNIPLGGLRQRLWRLIFPTIDTAHPSWFEAPPNPAEERLIRSFLAGDEYDLCLINYLHLAPVLERDWFPMRALRAVIAHDCWHLRSSKLAASGLPQDILPWDFASEKRAYQSAGMILHISEAERPEFVAMLGENRVSTIPQPLDWQPLHEEEHPGRVLFVGSAMEANAEGCRWFIREVWPLVRKASPLAEFHVCGMVCDMLRGMHQEGVVLKGLVQDIKLEYSHATVVVIPIFGGGGVKIKLMEAAGYGKACVSTPAGAEGIPHMGNSGIYVRESAGDFADAVLLLLSQRDIRRENHALCEKWMREHLSPRSVLKPFLAWAESSSPRHAAG